MLGSTLTSSLCPSPSHWRGQQRKALLLVGAEGVSNKGAAQICRTNLGTIKSRSNRSYTHLTAILALDAEQDFSLDRLVKTALFMHSS